jgi:hypothetical protein
MMKSVMENAMEAKIWGLILVVRFMVAMSFWLGES